MQPIKNRRVPRMLAAGGNRKIALVRNFCKNELCSSNGLFVPPAFLLFYINFLQPVAKG